MNEADYYNANPNIGNHGMQKLIMQNMRATALHMRVEHGMNLNVIAKRFGIKVAEAKALVVK